MRLSTLILSLLLTALSSAQAENKTGEVLPLSPAKAEQKDGDPEIEIKKDEKPTVEADKKVETTTSNDSQKIESIGADGSVKLSDDKKSEDKKESEAEDDDEGFEVKALENQNSIPTETTPSFFTKAQQDEIEKIIATYIEKHPEALVKAIQAFSEQQQKEQLQKEAVKMAKFKDDLTDDKTAIVGGNPNGTVKLVIFADPNCPHCRHLEANLNEIKGLFSNLKIYLRPWPIMGKESADVVTGLTAAAKQGYDKYDSLSLRISTSNEKIDKPKFMKFSKELGLDTKKLQKAMDSEEVRKEIKSNHELAVKLGLDATPTIILFDTEGAHIIIPGDKDFLKKTLSEAKA